MSRSRPIPTPPINLLENQRRHLKSSLIYLFCNAYFHVTLEILHCTGHLIGCDYQGHNLWIKINRLSLFAQENSTEEKLQEQQLTKQKFSKLKRKCGYGSTYAIKTFVFGHFQLTIVTIIFRKNQRLFSTLLNPTFSHLVLLRSCFFMYKIRQLQQRTQ